MYFLRRKLEVIAEDKGLAERKVPNTGSVAYFWMASAGLRLCVWCGVGACPGVGCGVSSWWRAGLLVSRRCRVVGSREPRGVSVAGQRVVVSGRSAGAG